MGLLGSLKKIRGFNSGLPCSSGRTTAVPVPIERALAISPDCIPADVFELLWFEDGPFKNYFPDNSSSRIEVDSFVVEVSFHGATEPSAISFRSAIRGPSRIDDVPRLNYYPSFNEMSPEQKWVYLNWLTNVDSSIDPGYLFVFYYGLERHLFFGKYEQAFRMVLRLRSKHKNSSFLGYSSHALVTACLIHNRPDLLIEYLNSIKSEQDLGISNLYLMAKYALGVGLSPVEIMMLSKDVGFTNRRYIKDEDVIFQQELAKLLTERYRQDTLPLFQFPMQRWPKDTELLSANYSLDSKQRWLEIPCLTKYAAFGETVLSLLQNTHENVKQVLKGMRRSGTYMPAKEKNVQQSKEPDAVFKKSKLFEGVM